MTFTVAIIGRPNVGKSTLFNRLVGRRRALVDDRPGVTRDRRVGEGRLGGLTFRVIDTPGLEDAPEESLEGRMRRQAERALDEADVALLLVDARSGITPMDRHFADWLRRRDTPVLVVANKCEGRAGEAGLLEAFELGLGEPIGISAEHGEGLAELAEALLPFEAAARQAAPAGPAEKEGPGAEAAAAEATAAEDATEAVDRPIRIAIVGRPNVGKSTLVNALLGDERVLTGPDPGVTRDAIEVEWSYRGRALRLVDTAGMRRRARITDKLEKLSVADALEAVRLADIVVLVLDADAILDKQDLVLASHVAEEGRALVVAVNKWDTVADPKQALQRLRDRLETSLPQLRGVPTVTISALHRQRLGRLMDEILRAYDVWNRRIGTGRLNRWLEGALAAHPPPMVGGRRLKLRYMTQVKARPPTFALWGARSAELPDSYVRYLTSGLREAFDLPGVPIRMLLRRSENPYAEGEGGR